MKCDKCKNNPRKGCCNDCKELEYCCHICKDIFKVKDYIKHLEEHYVNRDQYLECNMCKVYKHISFFRFRNGRCRLCIYLNRYRFDQTRNQFREHVYKYNIREVVWRATDGVRSPICEAVSRQAVGEGRALFHQPRAKLLWCATDDFHW